MDSYQFYKSLYDRELNRRKDADTAINIPLTIISIIVASTSYIIKELKTITKFTEITFGHILIAIIYLILFVSIFFLTRSYNNFFKGFYYKNVAFTIAIRSYETIEIPKYNNQVKEDKKLSFENIIINKLTEITDNHISINDKRSYDLYLAKTYLIVALTLTAIEFLIVLIKYLKL